MNLGKLILPVLQLPSVSVHWRDYITDAKGFVVPIIHDNMSPPASLKYYKVVETHSQHCITPAFKMSL